ncbi:LOW QUALITY PROTEIN: hypothetical protein RJ640_012789 [Escallonia rubra]|uniref:Magnesium transporter n=1 Tax=Escallonia rubra TaxID=112253 RepID=A0AA88UQ48_9ASTE|nr:LOW QUALITY PROTEIN: hypothetical protein RJ640_012789 [Escallonia rubra]
MDDEDDLTTADLAATYWELRAGTIWWCHVAAGHQSVDAWLSNAQWLHPAISVALRDESRLISDRMKHLLYEVPVRVAGGLLFELLGQSVGDPYVDEDDIPVLLRSWQAQNFLITALHMKGSASSINVLGITEVQGNATRSLLEGIRKSTREMIEEQEAVRGRLFTIQDVMQSTSRAWLQDRSLRVTHNLAVFGGGGLILSIITGLFGVNVDGMPGARNTRYAFGLFSAILFFLGIVLVAVGLLYLGLKKPITEEQLGTLELQELVKMFQHEAETHAQVRKTVSRRNLPPTAADMLDADNL